jgi:hypothetical protein
MTQWNPIWQVQIDGVSYTEAILSNLSIRSGRTNIYEQAQAGYATIQLIDLNQATIPVFVNSSLSIGVEDTSGSYVPIFGGSVVDIEIEVRDVGSVAFSQVYTITALGALARLQKALTEGVLSKDFDGNQILSLLTDLLVNSWNEVPAALSWADYDPTVTWATAENSGLGSIDTPGEYELTARSSETANVYSLVSGLATSGLGYIYEDAYGRISYADAIHRSQYLQANGYVDLTANQARAAGLKIETRAGDVRNEITIEYKNGQEANAINAASIANFGSLGQIINTTLENEVDAEFQANFYLALRKDPQAIFSEITFDLTNPELDNSDRDNLLNIFMGLPLAINDLPANMGSIFQGFVEGWSFQANYNTLSLSINLTPTAYSLQALQWNEISNTFTWSGVSPGLDWARATIVT